MEHPQRSDDRQGPFHRLPGKLSQERADQLLPGLAQLPLQQPRELVLEVGGRSEEVELREESGELPPADKQLLAGLRPIQTDWAASYRARVDKWVADDAFKNQTFTSYQSCESCSPRLRMFGIMDWRLLHELSRGDIQTNAGALGRFEKDPETPITLTTCMHLSMK